MIRINEDYCKGCGYCIRACPKKALHLSAQRNANGVTPPVADEEACTKCRLCEVTCPDLAITIEEEDEE
jgi:2-oxoglutarate ferredoxin oxidoreductase subunit delta